ncbi:MAG: protein-L-isoaspartate(D-aspartate) O-methyltransferase [Parcubacteria group bacterium]|nr:protein-L-isoaspartate(D-aspartate) O-methyltransferase [Parcubacteria group bacterium]
MVRGLQEMGYLRSPAVVEAFRAIDRKNFVLPEYSDSAYVNAPLPIGHDQTISQPLTVAFMLELLRARAGHTVLDIGSGSGWQTALLAHIVSGGRKMKGVHGKVYAIERIPELCDFGKQNISKYNFLEKRIVTCMCTDGSKGLPDHAPYDRIIAGASAEKLPQALLDQLAPQGQLVVPILSSVWWYRKKSSGEIESHEYPGFSFVPLITST